MSLTKRFYTSSSFCLFFDQRSTSLWTFFPQLWYSPLTWGFPLFLISLPQKLAALWSYFPQLLHLPLNNLLLPCFLYTSFSSGVFSSGYFYCFLLPPNSVFQNQLISVLSYLYDIFDIFTFQDTLTCLYYSDRMSNTRAFVSYSYFLYFSLISLNFRFKLYSLLNHMSGSWLVSFILYVFHLFVT